jgi:hypothetical protein
MRLHELVCSQVGLWNVIERFAMSIVGFLRDRQADILIGNEALPSQSTLQSLGFPSALVSWQNEQHPVSKNNVGPLKIGGLNPTRPHYEAFRIDGRVLVNEPNIFSIYLPISPPVSSRTKPQTKPSG